MPGFQYFVASSLDGFIATGDDNLDWLLQFDGFAGGQESYDAFMADVGCIVMGGDTYAWLRKHEPDNWPYPGDAVLGVHAPRALAPKGADVTFVRGPVAEFVEDLKAGAGEKNVWIVGGGVLAAQFADAGALDEIIISIIPVVLGSGKAVLPILRARRRRWSCSPRTPWAGASWSCATASGAARPSACRGCALSGLRRPMSRIRLVMRAVDSRRPCSSVMTISWVVRVRPRWIAVHVPVTVPAVTAR